MMYIIITIAIILTVFIFICWLTDNTEVIKITIIATLSTLLYTLIILGYNESHKPTKVYEVKIDYCDNRPSKILKVESSSMPTNQDISSYKEAMPRYAGEVNVCNINVIQ